MKIAIIGAGPAGIYTALMLKDFEGEIDLYEKKERIGQKLSVTGGGKMNIGNQNFSVEKFISNEKNILKNIFKNPASKNVLELFEKIGTKYKWSRDRAILDSEDAPQEIKRLEYLLNKQENLELYLNTQISKITPKADKFLIDKKVYDYVVITSGSPVDLGKSISIKEAYKVPLGLGHTLTEIEPALCPIIAPHTPFEGLEGLSLECELKNASDKKVSKGNLIFTHQGISGPVVLDFTINDLDKDLLLNFLPNLSEIQFKQKIESGRKGKVFLKTFLSELLPKRLVLWILNQSKIQNDKIIAELKKEDLKILVQNLYSFKLKDSTKSPLESGWTVRGGINLQEVSPATLESKLHKNLFFAGEILDVTGLCGGFNISFAMLSAKIVSDAINQ